MLRADSRLERLLHDGVFCVTAEVVPPRSADAGPVRDQARALVGYADAVNVTDNPTASAHMSPVAGAAVVARAGLEPTIQLTCRDRNRLGLTGELLGGWALGARNVLCLTGDPASLGGHPDAAEVFDLTVLDLVRLAVRLRDEGTLLSGAGIAVPPRYFVGVADVPLAEPYDVGRLEAKADAGADFVQTQIVYDVEAFVAWADRIRERGLFERMFVLAGVAPLRSARSARFVQEHLPGVVVPAALVERLEEAGDDAAEAGIEHTVEVVARMKTIEGVAGVHVMGIGHEESVCQVIERSGLFPRPAKA